MFKEILLGSMVIFGFKALGALSGLLLNMFVSRIYGAKVYGAFSLILTLILFLTTFSRLGLDLYVVRKIPELEAEATVLSFIAKALLIVLASSLCLALALFLTRQPIDELLFKDFDASSYLLWLGLAAAAYTLIFVLSSILRGFGELLRFSIFQSLYVPFCLLLILATSYYLLNWRLDVILALYAVLLIGALLNAYNVITFLRQKFGSAVLNWRRNAYKGPILSKSYPMTITSSAIFIMAYLGQFFVGYFLSLHDVGLYAAIVKLSIPLSFLSTAISSYIAPRITRAFLAHDLAKVKRIYVTTIAILLTAGTPILIGYCLFPEFFLGLFGAEFRSEPTAFLIYTLSVFIGATLFGPVGYFMVMTDNQFAFQRIILAALVLYVVSSLLLIPTHGIEGAALSTLFATLFWKLGGYLYLRWRGIF